MTNEHLLGLIEKAAREQATELDLSSSNLTFLPPEIGQLTKLTTLNLSYNQLTTLPREIGELHQLTELALRSNQFSSLPKEIGELRQLTVLNLAENQISSLPKEIGELRQLTALNLVDNHLHSLPSTFAKLSQLNCLYLSANQFNELPPEIIQLTQLTWLYLGYNQLSKLSPAIGRLNHLTTLYLQNNQLSDLPKEVGQLQQLVWLDLASNQLRRLPSEIGQLRQLTKLYLQNNNLSNLPSTVGQLQRLTKLDLRNNNLDNLPSTIGQLQQLTKLDLRNNNLDNLPSTIGQLQQLTELDLSSNQLLPISAEILKQLNEPNSLLSYYLKLQSSQNKPLNEAKLLIVGQPNVGKTALARRLIDNAYDFYKRMTDGINIRSWQTEVDEQSIRLNVWDFGGQEIFHATHQFFLTRRSLYLLVVDACNEEEANRIEYWLKIIQSFGGKSPIIVVGNKVDLRRLDINQRGLQSKYPTIKEFVETSCETGEGVEQLRDVINREIKDLEHIHSTLLPLSWFTLKNKLENLQEDFIPYIDYKKSCQEESINDEHDQQKLINILHELGIFLNFQNDDRLQETYVLNPEWVTKGIYSILNDNDLITNRRGILERDMLDRILDPQRYPRQKHLFILDLMRKFELCFDVETDRRWLIPDLLQREEPYTGEWQDALEFQYHYTVLPNRIISRFIVRMSRMICQETRWRNGVVLLSSRQVSLSEEEIENLPELRRELTRNEISKGDSNTPNIALVRADQQDKKIFIKIVGNTSTRREFLSFIRFQFEDIHETISSLEVEEKVPLPNYPDVPPVSYKYLLTLEKLGKFTFIPPGLEQEISVQELLNGVESRQERQFKPGNSENRLFARSNQQSGALLNSKRTQVFISYSQMDREWLDKFRIHLKPLTRREIVVWDDTQIVPGTQWKDEIEMALAAAKVAVLLVSPNFLASDFIYENELPPLLNAAKAEGLTILWVYLSHCMYDETEIKDYAAVHSLESPLDSLASWQQNQVWLGVCKQIKVALSNDGDIDG